MNWGMRSRTETPEPLHAQGHTDDEDHLDADDEDAGGKGKARKGKAKDKKKNRFSAVSSRAVTPDPEGMMNSRGGTDSPSHRYPPVSPDGVQRRTSDGSDEMVVLQAAKVLKNAVLHDARNIQGKEGETGGLVWDVTSAHEAKVCFPSLLVTIHY